MANFDRNKFQISSQNTFLNTNYSNQNQNKNYSNDNFWDLDPGILTDNFLTPDYLAKDLDQNLKPAQTENQNNADQQVIGNVPQKTQNDGSIMPSFSGDKSHGSLIKKPCLIKKVSRKLPIHFIDSKDWQMYLEFATVKNSNVDQLKLSRFKSNKVQRLLNSFYNLYQNYTDLFEEYETVFNKLNELQNNSSDSLSSDIVFSNIKRKNKAIVKPKLMKIPQTNNEQNLDGPYNETIEFNNAATQTYPVLEWSELNDSQLVDLFTNKDESKKRPNNFSNRKSFALNNNDSSNIAATNRIKKTKIYDHLLRHNFLGHQEIDIIEELQYGRPCVIHKMNLLPESMSNCNVSLSSTDGSQNDLINPGYIINSIATAFKCSWSRIGNNSSNVNNISLINIPILMDLLLPKIQLKVKYIFEKCPFLNNPLEIIAELRYFNYNKQNTVEYFKLTKQLRGSIKEFIKSNIDSRIRLVILRSLYQNDLNNSQNIDDIFEKGILSCSNCGKDLISYDTYTNKSLGSLTEKDSLLCKSPQPMSCSMDALNSTILKTEQNLKDFCSKSTYIEPGYFDNSIQDSFTQTPKENRNKNELYVIKRFVGKFVDNTANLKRSIKESKIQISHLKRQVSSLLKALKNNIDIMINLSSKHFLNDQHKGRMVQLSRQVDELKIKLKDEETKRRLVFNLMQEQMGNVRVYCRCRDIPHSENILEIQDYESIVLPILPQERFDFDKVFPSCMSQNDIYEEFRPLVMSFIDGFNVCFITYGSEASGKTYTLIGGNSDIETENGIMQRALTTLLSEQRSRSRDWEYEIGACLVEIYNDNCLDLLSGEGGIQLYVDCGMEAVYQKLRSVPVTSESDAEVLVQLCRAKRKVARTALNPASSRSHLITLIRLQGLSKIHGESIRSFMCLCDLAGFEDIIKAETQSSKTLSKEAGYINRSLTAFNRVFVSLRRQDPNTVCYRDTKLTHLLKPFLTNSGKCALIITVRTDRRSLSSTQNTLRFGRETRGVSLGKARRQQFNPNNSNSTSNLPSQTNT